MLLRNASSFTRCSASPRSFHEVWTPAHLRPRYLQQNLRGRQAPFRALGLEATARFLNELERSVRPILNLYAVAARGHIAKELTQCAEDSSARSAIPLTAARSDSTHL